MKKSILIIILLLTTIVPFGTVSAASGVKIPHSAAEWATFTPVEKAQAYAWVWQQAKVLNIGADLKNKVITQQTLAATSGGVQCGVAVSRQAWGSYSNGWAWAYTNASIYMIDTGVTNRNAGYWDTLYRNGNYFQSFGAAGGMTNGVWAQSVQDFKWAWESVVYTIRAYGTAQFSYQGPYLFYLTGCYNNAVA